MDKRFVIWWVAHHGEDRPIKIETADEEDVGMVVVSCPE
jgi:hypothetical protein